MGSFAFYLSFSVLKNNSFKEFFSKNEDMKLKTKLWGFQTS